MSSKKKSTNSQYPAPDPAPAAGQVAPKTIPNSSPLNSSILYLGNKLPSPYIISTYPPIYILSKDTNPLAADIGAKSSGPLPSSVIKPTI